MLSQHDTWQLLENLNMAKGNTSENQRVLPSTGLAETAPTPNTLSISALEALTFFWGRVGYFQELDLCEGLSPKKFER